jgi:tetratricopeptide (TPR) repeat protein
MKILNKYIFIVYCLFSILISVNSSYAGDNSKWLSINKKGMQSFRERDFLGSEKFYLKAIEEAKKSNLIAELSATLNNLGLLKIELLMFEEAEELIKESLNLRLQFYGINHRYIAQSYNNLARVYESSLRIEESVDLYIKAINIYESLGERYNMLLARTLINLSTVQLKIEELDVAQMNLIRALAISKNYSEDNSVSLSAMQNLAALFTQRGNFIEAEEIYLNLIDIRKNNSKDNSVSFARVLNNLAVLYKKQCKYDLAYNYISQAINIWKSLSSADYSNFAAAFHNQGELYKAQGKYDLAIESFNNGITILNNSIDNFYKQYVEQSYSLINLYLKIGMNKKANSLLVIVNKVRVKRGDSVIILDKLPDEIYEECSSSNI